MDSNMGVRLGFRWLIRVVLTALFVLQTLVFFRFNLFIRPPSCSSDVFIADAKPYYFEGTTLDDKEYEFFAGGYKKFWLQADGVSEVVRASEEEGFDPDFSATDIIDYVVIDGKKLLCRHGT